MRSSLHPPAPTEALPAAAELDTPLSISTAELVTMVAALMALNALAIDIMLPALDAIATDLGVVGGNDQQLVVVAYILGFGVPQLVWGPLSDRFGRRPVLFVSLIGYTLAGLACLATQSFEQLLMARFVHGVFASGCRVVAVAVVRDLFAGRGMARIMSLVMTIFMVVPILAPMLGQGVLLIAPWRWTFGVLVLAGFGMLAWTFLRLRETVDMDDREPLSVRATLRAYLAVVKSRVTFGYMVASGVVFGALFAFISASEQVFREVFGKGDTFVFWFAGVALALSCANFANSRLVERFGMRRLSHVALVGFIAVSLSLVAVMHFVGEELWLFFPMFAVVFALFGLIGANFNALAMEPLGKIAGTASAAYGFATTSVSGLLGGLIGRAYDGTTTPLLLGFAALGVASLIAVAVTERGRLFSSA
ncbi:MAG: multidrug effflux MFS transporter [Sandaracinaceae bacterium]